MLSLSLYGNHHSWRLLKERWAGLDMVMVMCNHSICLYLSSKVKLHSMDIVFLEVKVIRVVRFLII